MATFTFTPDFGASASIKPAVRSVSFGDGYAQRLAYGINTQPQSWSLNFTVRDADETAAIDAFLVEAGGKDWFYWTPPNTLVPLKFICSEWTRTIDNAVYSSISATFDQVFDL